MGLLYDELPRPIDFKNCWWSSLGQFPLGIADQNFGTELHHKDLQQPSQKGLERKLKTNDSSSGYSQVTLADDSFTIQLMSKHFLAKDLIVTFYRDSVEIQGRHEWMEEDGGRSFRSFTRRYMLPSHVAGGSEECCTREDHLLTIKIPQSGPIKVTKIATTPVES